MKLIDFLFYCNYKWTMRYSSTETNKLYAGSFAALSIAISFMIWGTTLARIIEFYWHHTQLHATQLLIYDAFAIGIFFLLKYIYVKKGRLGMIINTETPMFNIEDKSATKFVFITGFTSFLIFILVPILLNVLQ